MSTFHPLRTKVQTFRNGREISSRGVLENQKIRPARVIGPLGTLLAIEDLPPVEARWSPRRKAEVVSAVDGGLLSMAEACHRKSKVWFGLHEHGQPVFAFAGIWRLGEDSPFMAFLTCEANQLVGAVHPQAMLVMLTGENVERWLIASMRMPVRWLHRTLTSACG